MVRGRIIHFTIESLLLSGFISSKQELFVSLIESCNESDLLIRDCRLKPYLRGIFKSSAEQSNQKVTIQLWAIQKTNAIILPFQGFLLQSKKQ